MKLEALENQFTIALCEIYDLDEAKALFGIAAEFVLKCTATQLKMMQTDEVGFAQAKQLLSILEALKMGKPIQYILGEAYFYGFVFQVNQDVLIPRPETEELVEWIIQDNKNKDLKNRSLLDIGTGTGCIPIAIKKYLDQLDVHALDISAKALSVASANAERHGIKVKFLQADILNFYSSQLFDVVVSNPPYIRHFEKAEMHQNVLAHEPHSALFVPDENPLLFYQAITNFAFTNLKPLGSLYFEINADLALETAQIIEKRGFIAVALKKDMQGKYRMVKAIKPDTGFTKLI